jgi:hypothetical protein
MAEQVKVSGAWKNIASQYVKVGGTWRTITSKYVKVSGTWRQFYTSVIVRAFTGLSNNYPDNKGAVGFSVYSNSVAVRFGGESPLSNLTYSSDLINSPGTWTSRTAYPSTTQGPFGDNLSGTIWGIAGYPSLTGVYGTSNTASSWTTGASCSSAYWHESTYSATLGAIFKCGGFSSAVESFNGSSWTSRTSAPASQGFGALVEVGTRIYYFGGPGSETNSTACYSYNASNNTWTTETSQPVATRRTYGTNLDNKIIELGGEAISTTYIYSGTGGTWTASIAINAGSSYTTGTVSGTAAYGSAYTYTFRYA